MGFPYFISAIELKISANYCFTNHHTTSRFAIVHKGFCAPEAVLDQGWTGHCWHLMSVYSPELRCLFIRQQMMNNESGHTGGSLCHPTAEFTLFVCYLRKEKEAYVMHRWAGFSIGLGPASLFLITFYIEYNY